MASVLVVLYTNNTPQQSLSSYIDDLELRVLMDVSDNAMMRNEVLNTPDGTTVAPGTPLYEFFFAKIPTDQFNFSVKVCNLTDSGCLLGQNINQDVVVEDRIISSNLTAYSPKMVRLFMWEKLR
jgi:hypothetical protein